MSGYSKNIAVIRGLKEGFSADGGALSGLVKAERYGAVLKIEVSLINFAPLSEGRYVTGISDGSSTLIVEGGYFEGISPVETGAGFAALICYVNGQVSPVASAVSGNYYGAALSIRQEIERTEKIAAKEKLAVTSVEEKQQIYEDEAIAEVNYYEFEQADKSGGAVRKNTQKKKDGAKSEPDEAAFGAFKEERIVSPLARGNFYERMKDEIEGLLKTYPKEDALERVVENSKWVKINYNGDNFYVFGVIYAQDTPQYLCYGVPAKTADMPPESMRGLASFIPSSFNETKKGYWVMYQDAATGASLKIDTE